MRYAYVATLILVSQAFSSSWFLFSLTNVQSLVLDWIEDCCVANHTEIQNDENENSQKALVLYSTASTMAWVGCAISTPFLGYLTNRYSRKFSMLTSTLQFWKEY